jgi:predicted deacylase
MQNQIHNPTPPGARRNATLTAVAALGLCLIVGVYTGSKIPRIEPELPPPPVDLSMLQPPLVIMLERNADWDKPLHFPAPEVGPTITIAAPQLPETVVASHIIDGSETEEGESAPAVSATENAPAERVVDLPPAPVGAGTDEAIQDFVNADIPPGTLVQTTWTAGEALHGAQIPTPVLVARGQEPGPRLCVTAAVHGDELNGIEAVRRLMYSINPTKLTGSVVGVPIVNLQGFQRHSRYLSDRRDLNRFFPGNPRGSSASRMAYSFFNDIVSTCDGLVDLHTGSFHRTNLPQLRADLQNEEVLALTRGFGSTVILHSTGGEGTLRRAAVTAGIPAVTLEAGEPLRLQEDAVDHTVKALFTLLDTMQMYDKRSLWGNPEPTYYSSAWVRADQGGILMSTVKLGKKVRAGDELGTVTNPISNAQVPIHAPYAGRIIGMALNQFVMPGFATFHLAIEGAPGEVDGEEHFHAEGLDVAVSDSFGADESE